MLKRGKPTKAPASTPKPTEAPTSTVKPSGSLTREQIEKDLVYRHEQIKGPGAGGIMDEDGTSASDQGGTRTFFSPKAPGPGEPALTPREAYKLLPTEIRERMNQKDAEAAGLTITRIRGQAGGEDYVHDAHGGDFDNYIEELKSGGSQVREAKDFFKSGTGDPEAAFLGALHDVISRKKKQPKMGTVDASTLKEGDTFTVGGKQVRVEKTGSGESAYLVLKDGEDLPVTPVDAMGKVPVDKGSKGKVEDVPAAQNKPATPKVAEAPKIKEKTDGLPKEPDQAGAPDAKPEGAKVDAVRARPDAVADGAKPKAPPEERADVRGDAEPPRVPTDGGDVRKAEEPKSIGLNKAEQDHWRREFDMSELPDHEVRTHESVFAEVMRTKMHERAEEIAQDALDRGTPLTDMQHAAMQVKFAELANEYDALAEKSRLAKPEQKPGIEADLAKVRERIDVITDAARQAKRENARGMSIGRRMLDRESFRLVDVIKRAEEAKSEGKKNTQALTSDERARFEFTTKRLLEIQTELSDAMKGWERDRAKARKRDAQGVIQRSTAPDLNKYSVDARTKLRQKLSAERADIKKQLLGIGLRVNDIVGVAPEALYLVGRLALNYAREGTAITLDAITKKVQEDLPDLTDEQIHAAITMRDPARQLKAKTAATKRIEAVKKEAALLQKLTATAEKLAAEKPIKAMEAEKALREGQIKLNETSAAAAARKTASAATKASEKAARDAARKKTRADLGQMRMVLDQIRINAKDSIASGKRLEAAQKRIDALKEQLDTHTRALKKDKPVTPEAIAELQKQAREIRQEMRTEDTLTDLTEQLRTGQFRIPEPKAAEALPEHIQRMQIAAKKARRDIRIAINTMRPMTIRRGIGEGLNTLRTMKATADMSATLRQGLLLSVRRPVVATKAFQQSVRAFFSEHTAEQIDHALRNDPKQLTRDRAGLYLAELDGPNPNAREEAFMSTIVQRIPGFNKVAAASERHMVTHMNLIRAAAFDAFAEKHTNATPTELKAWADYVNKASGRGNLGNFAGAATELSSVFFAPRYGLSRIQTPLTLAKYWQHKRVRVEIAKDLAAFVGTGMLALTLAHAAGAGVTLDPRDPDFGKIRIGNTHVDIWAGFQQPARLVARAMAGITDQTGITGKTLTKQEKDFNPVEALGRFAAFKLSPAVTVPLELYRGKDITGQPTTRLKTLATMGLPLLLTDVAEAAKQEGPGAAILAGGSSFFGFGASTYPDSEAQTRRKIRELINAGQPGEAAQARLEWNAKNPDNKISSNPPKPKKD